ncbi:unnamed protein product [Mytilus edulis]|uniref:PHD-type domain-containing protein n=1 Tax=Mytilus edulis TaxID=6550 RepID=A0A8S3SC91_MYTED|nr:unnamed protein product [Mytilus edulis]
MSSTEDSDSGLSQSNQVAADIMSILASGDEASFSGFSAVADESVHFSPPKKRQLKSVVVPPESVKKLKKTSTSKQNNERGPDILDRNDSFSDINEQIREYCEQFLNKSGQSAENCQEIETASTGKKLSSLNVNKALSLPAVDNAACGNEPLIGPQFPLCLVCNKQCDENPTSVACDICYQWIHFKCEGLTHENVLEIELKDDSYICRMCTSQRGTVNSDIDIAVNSCIRQANLNSNTESVGQTPSTRTFELKENCQPTAMTESLLDQVNTLPSGPNMANSPDNTELHKAEIAHLQTQIEKRDKLLKVKDSKILKYESEIDQLKKQLATNRAYSITLEDKNKDLQHSLLIINQRVEQLENYPTQGSTNSHSCTQNVQSTPQSEIGEMKIWFLEQKVRQLELDVHKNNTELTFIRNSHVPHVKTSRGKKRRKPYMQNDNNKTHAQSASLHNICHQMDDFLLNTRSDETISMKSYDENSDFLGAHSPTKSARAISGLYSKKFEKFVELLPDGGNRIIGIKFNTTQPFIFLSTYLPCRGNANSIDNYQEILDELSEIYIKYSNAFRIVIGGDMNASIYRDSKQDKVFRDFIKENNLLIPPSCGKTFTFYHYNGRDTSQIDYFLESKSVISNYLTFIRESINTSTHDPILTTIPCNIQANEEINSLIENKRINWNKVDKTAYQEEIENKLSTWTDEINLNLTFDNIPDKINELCTIMAASASKCSRSKRSKCKRLKKKPWTPELENMAKINRDHFAKWKAAGRPTDKSNILFQNIQFYKKKLRSMQRQLEASLRINKYQKIMELHEGNDAGFYSLVRKQRNPANTTTTSLTFNDISLNNDNLIRDAWMDYFQDLASPMDSENFDKEHFSLVENDIKHLTKTFTENKIENISPVTEVEMKSILASMKNNKSADEENIAAEHLKYGGPIMITIMTFLINAIFKHLHIPTLLKGGIACPVLKNGKPKIDPELISENNYYKYIHLGIDRNITKNAGVKEVVNKRITTTRKTVYSLMGAGLHGPGKNKKGKAPVKRGNIAKPSDKDKEREDEFRRIYSKLELLLDRQNSNADRYELASAPEHAVAPEEDEGEDDDKFGDETHKSIAALVNAVTNRKSVITEIAKDYKVPSNSKSLAPPKVNPEIWHLLNRQARSDDLSFQTIQRILGFGIVPVIRTAEALTKPDAVKTVAKMRVNINNALSMLCAAFFEISYVRRMTLKNNMDQKYHQLCTRHLDVTEYLFGDDVSKKVKDINDAQKMKGVVNTATSKNWRQGGCSYGCPPGFLVNKEKSVFIPTQRIIFLGYLIDSVQFKVFLTEEKIQKILKSANKIYSLYNPVIREVSSLIGLFTSASCAVLLAPIFHRYLDIEKTLALSKNNDNYDGIMSLSENSRNEILWWIKNVDRNEGKSISFGTPTEYIETDASKIGWGAVYDPDAMASDAFSFSWKNYLPYVFPPFSIIARILNKVEEEQVRMVLMIVPTWPSQPWFPRLLDCLVDYPVILPFCQDLLRLVHNNQKHPLNMRKLFLVACVVSGIPSKRREFQNQLETSSLSHGESLPRDNMNIVGGNGILV